VQTGDDGMDFFQRDCVLEHEAIEGAQCGWGKISQSEEISEFSDSIIC
jgi:hypothetical protein